MDYFKSRKLKNRFQNVEPHEPEDQLTLYQGGSFHQILPPLTKLGGAKTQETIAAAAAKGPAPAPRPTQQFQDLRSQYEVPSSFGQRFNDWTSRCATATQSPASIYNCYHGQPEKRPRPATADTPISVFAQPCKLPPINEMSNRGPLPNKIKPKSSKKNRLSARSKKNGDTACNGGSGDGNESGKRPQTPFVKTGSLARRFAQPEPNLGIRPGDDAFTRLDKMRSTLQMFNQAPPAYKRRTDILEANSANNGSLRSAYEAHPEPEQSRSYQRPPSTFHYREGDLANQYRAAPPSPKPGYKRHGMIADRMDIQINGYKKNNNGGYYNVTDRDKFSRRMHGNTFSEDVVILDAIMEDE